MNRDIAKDAKRWVIKIGSALLTNDGAGLDRKAIDSWVEQICPVAESRAMRWCWFHPALLLRA